MASFIRQINTLIKVNHTAIYTSRNMSSHIKENLEFVKTRMISAAQKRPTEVRIKMCTRLIIFSNVGSKT